MAELHETRMGKTLIDHTFPKIAKQLERIADTLGYIENSFTHNNGKENKGIFEDLVIEITKYVDTLELISDALELRNLTDAIAKKTEQEKQVENKNLSSYLKHYEMISLCASEGLEQDKDFEQVGHKWRRI